MHLFPSGYKKNYEENQFIEEIEHKLFLSTSMLAWHGKD